MGGVMHVDEAASKEGSFVYLKTPKLPGLQVSYVEVSVSLAAVLQEAYAKLLHAGLAGSAKQCQLAFKVDRELYDRIIAPWVAELTHVAEALIAASFRSLGSDRYADALGFNEVKQAS